MNIFKKSQFIGTIIVVAATSSIGAVAGEAPRHGHIPFAAFDRDGNGWVSKQEFQQVLAEMMSRGGANGNARIPTFSDFDKNGDGKLTKGELSAGH